MEYGQSDRPAEEEVVPGWVDDVIARILYTDPRSISW